MDLSGNETCKCDLRVLWASSCTGLRTVPHLEDDLSAKKIQLPFFWVTAAGVENFIFMNTARALRQKFRALRKGGGHIFFRVGRLRLNYRAAKSFSLKNAFST